MIIRLYVGGMTIRDIQNHLASTIGTDLHEETTSTITDTVLGEVSTWQTRQLGARRSHCCLTVPVARGPRSVSVCPHLRFVVVHRGRRCEVYRQAQRYSVASAYFTNQDCASSS